MEEAIQKLRQHHELYTAAQQRLTSQRARFMQKGPEIKATLSAVQLLMRQREKQETVSTSELSIALHLDVHFERTL